MGKIKRFLDYYRGRISYTEVMNMSMREFQALYYIMFKEIEASPPADDDGDGNNNNLAMKQLAEELEDE